MTCAPEELAAVKEHLSSMGEDVCNLSATNAVSRLIAHGKKMKNRYDAAKAVMSLSAEDDTDGVQPGLLAEARRVLHIRVPAAATPARAEQQAGAPRMNALARAAAAQALAADFDADGVQPDLLAEARRVLHIGERAPLALANDLSGGRWVTINGAHVYIKDGQVVAGPPRLLAKSHEPPEAGPDQLYEVCFAAGTLVVMEGGGKTPIEAVEAGAMVMAVPDTDPTAVPRPCRVLRVRHNAPASILYLHVGDGSVCTTENHLLFERRKGWIAAGLLTTGDELRTIAGGWIRVRSADKSNVEVPVFNLEVEEARTYFVEISGDGTPILVHNQSPATTQSTTQKSTSQSTSFTPDPHDEDLFKQLDAEDWRVRDKAMTELEKRGNTNVRTAIYLRRLLSQNRQDFTPEQNARLDIISQHLDWGFVGRASEEMLQIEILKAKLKELEKKRDKIANDPAYIQRQKLYEKEKQLISRIFDLDEIKSKGQGTAETDEYLRRYTKELDETRKQIKDAVEKDNSQGR